MPGTRPLLVALVVVLGSCTLAAAAAADTAAIAFTDANGMPDAVARTNRTVTITGTTSAPEHLYVKYRAAGGAPCASSWHDDPGDVPFTHPYTGDSFADAVSGDFTLSRTGPWPSVGAQLFCIWLAGSPTQSVTPIGQVVTFRAPIGTIAVNVTPPQIVLGEAITVTIRGSSEAPAAVDATLHSGVNFPCAASYRDDGGRTLVGNHAVHGAFSFTATTTELFATDTMVCVLADRSVWALHSLRGTATGDLLHARPLRRPGDPGRDAARPRGRGSYGGALRFGQGDARSQCLPATRHVDPTRDRREHAFGTPWSRGCRVLCGRAVPRARTEATYAPDDREGPPPRCGLHDRPGANG